MGAVSLVCKVLQILEILQAHCSVDFFYLSIFENCIFSPLLCGQEKKSEGATVFISTFDAIIIENLVVSTLQHFWSVLFSSLPLDPTRLQVRFDPEHMGL